MRHARPFTLPNGHPFPYRDLIVFLSFFVIAVTLIGQGLTLPALIRKLKVGSKWNILNEQRRVRAAMSSAALSAIDQIMARESAPAEWADLLRAEILDRITLVAPDGVEVQPRTEFMSRLRLAAILAERKEMIRMWQDNEISDEVMRHLEEVLDYQEAHL